MNNRLSNLTHVAAPTVSSDNQHTASRVKMASRRLCDVRSFEKVVVVVVIVVVVVVVSKAKRSAISVI